MSLLATLAASASRRIVLDGDSIWAGGNANTPLNTTGIQLAALLPQCVVANVAVSGAVSANCPHSGWNAVGPVSNMIFCIEAGHNDLNAGDTAVALHASMSAVVTLVRSYAPWRIVVQTVLPSTALVGSKNTERLAYNAAVRLNKCGADAVYDAAADPFWADYPVAYGPEGDGTGDGGAHPGILGTLHLMTGLAAVINGGLL